MIYSNSKEGSGNPTGNEYTITYRCGGCGNTLKVRDCSCRKCGRYIDWLDMFKIKYGDGK
jgi:hypothetical protein